MKRVLALKSRQADAMIAGIGYDLLVEKDGFKPLVYVKDLVELPIMALFTHEDRIRERPQEVERVLIAILRGISYTKSNREEVLPLLKDFVGLEGLEAARKVYEAVKDIWPENGLTSEEGLKNAFARAGLPASISAEKIVNWSILKKVTLPRRP
jgi:ABC-type nitrate/sulfonate/bicarbonate transport system substrate-binding protein